MKRFYQVRSCPFCGHLPTMQSWHGGSSSKRMVMCENEDCEVAPSVTGSTGQRAVDKWNARQLPMVSGSISTTARGTDHV